MTITVKYYGNINTYDNNDDNGDDNAECCDYTLLNMFCCVFYCMFLL